jgi:hypothetical protein
MKANDAVCVQAWNPDGSSWMVTGSKNGSVAIHDLEQTYTRPGTPKLCEPVAMSPGPGDPVVACAWTPENIIVVAFQRGMLPVVGLCLACMACHHSPICLWCCCRCSCTKSAGMSHARPHYAAFHGNPLGLSLETHAPSRGEEIQDHAWRRLEDALWLTVCQWNTGW